MRIAHDKATGKEDRNMEEAMREQIVQLVAQIETGKQGTQESEEVKSDVQGLRRYYRAAAEAAREW